jgi:pyridoxal phosphate enzyme (YggS family)
MEPDIAARLGEVRRRIQAAARRSGRPASEVTLVAVGKTWPAETVAAAVQAGVTDLGENRVQEAAAKKPAVPPARWHLIGPLQSNKARRALETFDVVHTVDRPRIAERLEHLLSEGWPGRRLPVLLEINVGEEPQKAGVVPSEAESLARVVLGCAHLELRGLMCIPPFSPDPEASRPYFRRLGELRNQLEAALGAPLPDLSMGMSHDFEVAVEEGATLVRVGTAIFGPRR